MQFALFVFIQEDRILVLDLVPLEEDLVCQPRLVLLRGPLVEDFFIQAGHEQVIPDAVLDR